MPASAHAAASSALSSGPRLTARWSVPQPALRHLSPALQEQVHSLGQHLRQCQQAQGRWFGLGRLGHEVHGWVAPRFVTTLAGASLLIALACLF